MKAIKVHVSPKLLQALPNVKKEISKAIRSELGPHTRVIHVKEDVDKREKKK